ncbi:hypothetical protein [Maricaulis sp. CAU 1757]
MNTRVVARAALLASTLTALIAASVHGQAAEQRAAATAQGTSPVAATR